MHPVSTQSLGPGARGVIDRYLALPIGARPSCPYFNNRRRRARAGLRALMGKGLPEEIAEEAEIRAIQSRIAIRDLSKDALREFLVDHDLGIDCSGFAYHVLSAELLERSGGSLARSLRFKRSGIVGALIARLRPAENAGVATFRLDENSADVPVADARPGDFITFMGTGREKTYNHIVVVTAVERSAAGTRLSYAHSYAWPSDGMYGHGVREGTIFAEGDDLLAATWTERGAAGADNFTLATARDAKEVSLRRLRAMA